MVKRKRKSNNEVAVAPPAPPRVTLTQMWTTGGGITDEDEEDHDESDADKDHDGDNPEEQEEEDFLAFDLEDEQLEQFTQRQQLSQDDGGDVVDDLLIGSDDDDNDGDDGEGGRAAQQLPAQQNNNNNQNPFVDTEDKVFLRDGRIFKRGETHMSLSGKCPLYYISRFGPCQNLRKVAVCGNKVFIDLKHTFLGPNEANRLVQNDNWKKLHPVDSNLAVVSNPNTAGLSKMAKVELRNLNVRMEDFPAFNPPNPTLYYDCETTKSMHATKWNASWRFKFNNNNNNNDHPHQRQRNQPPSSPLLPSRPSRDPTPQVLDRPPRVLELFAGASGMGLGFTRAGMDLKYVVDNDPDAASTLEANNNNNSYTVFCEDVRLLYKKVKDGDPCVPQPGDVDHIHSSSPCKGFSGANRTGGKDDNMNNWLALALIDFIDHYRPSTATFENVTGMLDENENKKKKKKKRRTNNNDNDNHDDDENIEFGEFCFQNNCQYLRCMVRMLLELGYQVRVTVLDASDYGDAQARKRVILFAARYDYKLPDRPIPTHGGGSGDGADQQRQQQPPKRTVRDVLAGLEDITPVKGSGRVKLPNGKIVDSHNSESTGLDRKEYYEMNPDKPAGTILCQRAVKHYALDRCLTLRERARLQGFPDEYKFCGKLKAQRDQIGNAVPVGLAHAIGRSIMDSYTSRGQPGRTSRGSLLQQ